MNKNIVIQPLKESVEEKEVEIIERKGAGHPDYICDAVSETASQALSQYYIQKFGSVLHHNLDKGLLIAGRSEPKFGGGKIVEPIKIIIAGRATDRVGKVKIPVVEIAQKAAKDCLSKILDISKKEVDKNFKISIGYQPGATNLQEVFKKSNKIAISNDTSFGVSHGPLSRTEKLTLDLAELINSKNFSRKYPFVGKDIKVMALRKGERVYLTLAIAFVDKFVKSIDDYFAKKERVKTELGKYIQKNFNFKTVEININVLDNSEAKDATEIYLTHLGLSAEQGDDGQVGRGNRVCGLITPFRQMSMEAAAGKNINHPGKLYQVLSFLIAQKIGEIKDVKECRVKLLSQIGMPLDSPQVALIELKAENFNKVSKEAYSICEESLNNLRKIQQDAVWGKYPMF